MDVAHKARIPTDSPYNVEKLVLRSEILRAHLVVVKDTGPMNAILEVFEMFINMSTFCSLCSPISMTLVRCRDCSANEI